MSVGDTPIDQCSMSTTDGWFSSSRSASARFKPGRRGRPGWHAAYLRATVIPPARFYSGTSNRDELGRR